MTHKSYAGRRCVEHIWSKSATRNYIFFHLHLMSRTGRNSSLHDRLPDIAFLHLCARATSLINVRQARALMVALQRGNIAISICTLSGLVWNFRIPFVYKCRYSLYTYIYVSRQFQVASCRGINFRSREFIALISLGYIRLRDAPL